MLTKTLKTVLLFSIVFFVMNSNLKAQKIVEPSPIVWYTPEQADSLYNVHQKPMLFNIYTDWCSWCKHMMKTTFATPGVSAFINQNFIPVYFNAEGTDSVVFREKTYTNKGVGQRPKHEFADRLLNGRFSFPTIVYMDLQANKYPVPGYQDAKNIEPYLIYFAESVYANLPLDNFLSDFMFSYPDRFSKEIENVKKNTPEGFVVPDTSGQLQSYSFSEAEALSMQNNKPILIVFSVQWCHTCKILEKIPLRNPELTKVLNQNFYTILFDAASQESFSFMGSQFEAGEPGHPHTLTHSLLRQSFLFPAYVIISPEKQIITELHGYMNAQQLETIMSYFSNENYKRMSYDEFLKTRN